MSYPTYPGQPGYPTPPPPPLPPVRTSTGGPKAMTLIGIIGFVLGIAGLVGGIAMIAQSASSVVSAVNGGSDSIASIDAGDTGTATLKASTTYAVWMVYQTSSRPDQFSDPEVTGPDGNQVTVTTDITNNASYDFDGQSVQYVWKFTTGPAGKYEITPQLSSGTIVVTQAFTTIAMKAGIGVVLLLAGLVVGFIGTVLLIWGAIWWGSRSKKKKAQAQQGPPLQGPSFA